MLFDLGLQSVTSRFLIERQQSLSSTVAAAAAVCQLWAATVCLQSATPASDCLLSGFEAAAAAAAVLL